MNGYRTRFLTFAVGMLLLWVMFAALAPLVTDGFLYSIKQPVPVTKVTSHRIWLSVDRNSRFNMSATCSNELQCDFLYEYGYQACPLEVGRNEFIFTLPIPKGAAGTCIMRGTVEYDPFGPLGPNFTYFWESELFEILGK